MGSIHAHDGGEASATLTNTQNDMADVRYPWQELDQFERFVQDYGWAQQSVPQILNSLPQHIIVNEKLRNILHWSLKRYEPRAVPVLLPETPAESESSSLLDERLDTILETDLPVPEQGPSTTHDIPAPTPVKRQMSKKTRPLFFRLRHLRQDIASKIATNKSQPQAKAPTPPVEEAVPENGECISCFDEFPSSDLVHLECSDDYCKACLREVISNAMKTESAFPPKCCLSEVPLKTILVCLDKQQREEYQEKAAEYAIPAGHRWYCPEPKCARWIKPEKLHKNRRAHQTCPHCKVKICSICRSVAHDGNAECPQDFGLNSTLEVAESEGWRRCYSCRTMVELTTGCRHITCRCGAEFCYVCNARWRTCSCTESDKIRRLAELRTQREERERLEREREQEQQRRQREDAEAAEVAEAEAREIAEAIAQIEEMERQDAIRRAEEEERRRLEEELALARLEEERLLQEIARREAEEEAERQLRQILIQSSKEECHAMAKTLAQIIEYQHMTLMSQHAHKATECLKSREKGQESVLGEIQMHKAWLDHNIELRRKALVQKQEEAYTKLAQQNEEEEDDLFMQMHMHLRNKPNREQREKKMRDALQMQQKVKKDELDEKIAKDVEQFEKMLQYELDALQLSCELRMQCLKPTNEDELYKAGHVIGGERRYFEVISQRRKAMIAAHESKVLRQVEAEEDPVGFEEDDVHDIEPILPSLSPYRDGADAPEVTPLSTTFPTSGMAHSEDDDLYGPDKRQSHVESELDRSETVTRAIPGAYPRSTVASVQSPSTYNPMSAPRYYSTAGQQSQFNHSETQALYDPNPSYRSPSYEHTSRSSMDPNSERIPVAVITPDTDDYRVSRSIASASDASRDSASFDSENIESNRTSLSTRASPNREWLTKNKEQKDEQRTSIFGFIRKKELTDNELKKRYSQAAGDSFGR